MKIIRFTLAFILIAVLSSYEKNNTDLNPPKEFQGKALYFAKSTMELGRWGNRLSEAEKKQVKERLKNRLEKTYTLEFNKSESLYTEEQKLDAMSGATDSWGKNFTPGKSYKNIKENLIVQNQEFYGKKFLIKDSLAPINWSLGSETKQIGKYTCYKAIGTIPSKYLNWYSFSWSELRQSSDTTKAKTPNLKLTNIEAWYTPQIPISSGPGELNGLPGLILEASSGNTTLLCYKVTLNSDLESEIKAPEKGKIVTKEEYKSIITQKMKEFRYNRMGR